VERIREPVATTEPVGGKKTMFDHERIFSTVLELLCKSFPRNAKTVAGRVELVNLSNNILQIARTDDARSFEDMHAKLVAEKDRAARYRCSKCGAQMLLADTTCRVCENRELLAHLTMLRTVLTLTRTTMVSAAKIVLPPEAESELKPGQPPTPLRSAFALMGSLCWRALGLVEAALAEPVPAVSGPNRNAWDMAKSALGLGMGWVAYTMATEKK
jgi:hypothetical protein